MSCLLIRIVKQSRPLTQPTQKNLRRVQYSILYIKMNRYKRIKNIQYTKYFAKLHFFSYIRKSLYKKNIFLVHIC